MTKPKTPCFTTDETQTQLDEDPTSSTTKETT